MGFLKVLIKSEMDIIFSLLCVLLTALICNIPLDVTASVKMEDDFFEFADPDDTSTVDLSEPLNSQSRLKSTFRPPPPPPHQHQDSASHREDGKAAPLPSPSNEGQVATEDSDDTQESSDTHTARTEDLSSGATAGDTGPFHSSDDEEEFEGLPLPASSSYPDAVDEENSSGLTKDKPEKPNLIIAKLPQRANRLWRDYHLEMVIVLLLGVYLLNFLNGRTKNSLLASAWLQSHKPLLDANFFMVGDDGTLEPGSGTLVKESEHLYSLWCSGRIYCEAMVVELRLIKRQCLLFTLANWLQPTNDNIIAKVIMDDSEMDGWVMAIGRKRRLQTLVKDHQDLNAFCTDKRGQKHPALPDSLTVISEIPEACTSILNAPVCKFLNDNEDTIEYLYFSDQYTGPKPPQDEATSAPLPTPQKVLIFCFKIGNKGTVVPENMEDAVPLFQFIFYVIDKVHRLRLGKESKNKSERNRQRAHDSRLKIVHSQRQEAAQTRREQRTREVKERILTTDDPEEARKLEEREQRKEKSKRQPKMKMLKMRGM